MLIFRTTKWNLHPILTLLFILFASTATLAQKADKLKKNADLYFNDEYYDVALSMYRELDSLTPGDPEVKFKIGVCYIHSPFETKSLPYFEEAEKLGFQGDNFEYYFGRADHLNHLFDDAIKHYKKYQSQGDTVFLSRIPKLIQECNNGKEIADDSLHIVIENLGPVVNTKYPEYVPIISADESVLIFTARRPNTTGGRVDLEDEMYYEDIYVSYAQDEGGWTKPKKLGANINTKKHDACVGLSPDGQKLFIYKTNKSKFGKSGDIWVSSREGDDWTSPIKLGENINTEGWEPSASITADGKTLYFSSNRPGGIGGTDIYTSQLDEHGNWGPPVNMGPTINTPEDDDAPFIHVDGVTLYFSSKGHKTMGGYDIFISHKDSTNAWSAPKNIGYPINTADDDIYFVWSADGKKGYFASFRDDSYGEKDLYVAKRPAEASHLIVFKGYVKDAKTLAPLASSIKITDLKEDKVVGIYNSNVKNGKYTIILPHGKEYNITIEQNGYLFYSGHVEIPQSNHYLEVRKDIYLEPIFVEDSTTTGDSLTEPPLAIGSMMTLRNIFFDFDKATLRPESKVELNNLYNLLKTYPSMYVELSGHTDSYGTNKYNQILSEKRAVAVVKYLVDKGIDKERMVAIGYGEEKPVVENSSDSLRQLNRRTELKLISKDDIKNYSKRVINLNKWDKKDGSTNTTQPKATKVYSFTKELPKPDAGIYLNAKVHFMSNNHDFISDWSKSRLSRVIALMQKYPEMKLRLHAHADQFGSDIYNQELSEKRAETVKKYLADNGVSADRIEISTYGEELPHTHSEEEVSNLHNRRVEFEVIY